MGPTPASISVSEPSHPDGPGQGEPATTLLIADDHQEPPQALDDTVADLPSWRRWVILFVVCWMTLPTTFISTSIMTATIEIAAGLRTTPTSINTANAGVFVSMAMSPLLWLPMSVILGRRTAYLLAAATALLCSIGCALADSLPLFTALWVVSGTTGPFFLVAGQTILADIFEPTVRGSAVGIFLGSSVSAQSLAPMFGGIIVSFTSWRVILGLQGGMALLGLVLAFFFVPRASQLSNPEKKPKPRTSQEILRAFNPMAVFRQWRYPSIILANLTCGLLAVVQYSLLSPIRHIINPRFNLTSPLYSGLFYLSPGVGFLSGSLVGGSLSDRAVKRYKQKRDGVRLPEDRLNGCLPMLLFLLPASTLLYGWSLEMDVGGIGLPIASVFVEGFALMAGFSGLNTYAAEANPEFKSAVISGKYVVQLGIGAGFVGGTIPMIDRIGVGWSFTITGLCGLLGGCVVLFIAEFLVRDMIDKPKTRISFHRRKTHRNTDA